MDLNSLLSTLASVMGTLCGIAALLLYAMGKVTSNGDGRGEGMLIGLVCASAACFAAAAFAATANLNITVNS